MLFVREQDSLTHSTYRTNSLFKELHPIQMFIIVSYTWSDMFINVTFWSWLVISHLTKILCSQSKIDALETFNSVYTFCTVQCWNSLCCSSLRVNFQQEILCITCPYLLITEGSTWEFTQNCHSSICKCLGFVWIYVSLQNQLVFQLTTEIFNGKNSLLKQKSK